MDVAIAAFCLWLTVRIVNRRGRGGKRGAGGLAAVVGYSIRFGAACWISSRFNVGAGALAVAYHPLAWVISSDSRARHNGERGTLGLIQIAHALKQYAELGAAQDWSWHPNYRGIDWGTDAWIWSR